MGKYEAAGAQILNSCLQNALNKNDQYTLLEQSAAIAVTECQQNW